MSNESQIRVDKWLWASRFFKARALAANAVTIGRVKVNGDRTKPSKQIKVGNRLSIQLSPFTWEIEIMGLSLQRLSAELAKNLYEESSKSQERRHEINEQLKLEKKLHSPRHKGRPTKRDRTQIIRFKQNEE